LYDYLVVNAMKVYGFDYAETRSSCEACGFPCFDDEIICPNCNKLRSSELGSDNHWQVDYYYKYDLLNKASKRGHYVRIILYVVVAVFFVAVTYFPTVENVAAGNWYARRSSLSLLALVAAVPYIFLLGQPGMQCSRMIGQPEMQHSDMGRLAEFRRPRGLLRRFQDGQIAESVYTVLIFAAATAIIALWMEPYWIENYYSTKASTSLTLYVFAGMGALYTVNTLMFAGYFLYNLLCPYDYQAELTTRLKQWKKQHPKQ
jgi:hypothetical protein